MTPPESATRHVVARCPTCGVEHGAFTPECDACHTPLRPWCRVHGREAGWLDAPACPRAAWEAEPAADEHDWRAEVAPRPRRSRADDGVAEPAPPPRWGFALVDAFGLALGGAVLGILAGPFAGGPMAVETVPAARAGSLVLGLAGLVIGLIRVAAMRRADQRRREGGSESG